MDLKSLFCLSPCRLILGLACAWMLSAESNAQTILFHETFDNSDEFVTTPSFAARTNGNNPGGAHWGLWDNSSSAPVDFGGDEGSVSSADVPGNGASWGAAGAILVGRDMDHNQIGAEPGVLEWNAIDVSGFSELQVKLSYASHLNQGNNQCPCTWAADDGWELFYRPTGTSEWLPLMSRMGPVLGEYLALTEVSSDITVASANVDFRLEMSVDRGLERLAFDDLVLSGCQDSDGDSICDDVDTCVGSEDACGVCNGPGEIYECGCSDIAIGTCDCEGNVPDAIDVCGGSCTADEDDDGICDNVDDCVGQLDECGVCNGPGDIYECGCSDIPSVDCDCDGNQLDALGVCGGDCAADANANGVCDDQEEQGCDDLEACNYDPDALAYDPPDLDEGYCLELRSIQEHASGLLAGMTTYRIYLHTENPTDFVSAVSGDLTNPMSVMTTTAFYQDPVGAATASDINPELYDFFPFLEFDSWVTIGLEDNSGTLADVGVDFVPFEAGGDIIIDDPVGGSWYVLNGNTDGSPEEDGTVLLAQLTTDGDVSGNMFIQVFPSGDNTNYITIDLPIGGNCIVDSTNPSCSYEDSDGDGVCDEDDACSDLSACNFSDPLATECLSSDVCGVCGGPGTIYECGCNDIPAGYCDCEGNQADALGVCGGDCESDADNDGVCDDVDPCVGAIDACGVCNGPGAVYECGCAPLPEGYCDCANSPIDAIGECGGDCAADADSDGVCDDEDDCIGELDECGVCNGPGEIYDCGCSEIPDGDCDCDGVQFDALGICGGLCESDADADGVCDDVDPCVGELDACGVCNGPGEVYECGCADIPEGDCDCSGTESEEVVVTIIPDNYGSEISWAIQDAEDNVVLSGGPYTNFDTDAIVVSAPLCPACYTFTIYDSWGDGLSGGGNYSLTAGGQTLIQGTGDYGTSESSGFCIAGDQYCALTGSYSGDLAGLDFGSEILLPLSLNASIDSVEFALDFDGPGGLYWASDMAIVLTNPAGQCVTLEGALTTMLPTCSPNGYEFWPSSWDSSVDGTYEYTYSGGLIGEVLGTDPGDWTIQVVNAWEEATARVSYDLTWTAYLDCSGCMDPDACNYDVNASVDDGSCINPDPSLGCCETLGDVCVSLEGGSQSEPYQFAAGGTLETLELELGWTNSVGSGGTANYPGAFAMVIESPNGACVHFGEGSDAFAPSGCSDAGGYTIYGSGWGDPSGDFGNTAVVLESTLDLSEFGLAGNGAWTITLGNGVSVSDAVSYSVNWALDYLCPLEGAYLGCLDPLACNYSSESTIDDGSCDYLSCGCSVSGSQLDTLSFDNWAGQTEQVEVGTNPDPTLFFVDLNFTNVSADGNGEEDPSSFASDMLVTVIDAGGNCTWWGGFNWYGAAGISAPPGCEPSDELAGASWDACWDISESGQYSDAIDLSSAGLSGAGTWEVTVYNGWSWIVNECPPGSCLTQHYGDAIYDVEWALIGACSGYGCTDEAACNYDEAATIDDGSCAELDDCGVCDGDGSSCSGCTDEYACNYDPLAIIDDGSCDVVIDTIVGCCTYSDTAVAVTLGGAGNEEVWTVLATSIGGLGEFELTIDFAPSGSMVNWASDVLVSFIDPNGLCYYFGGNQFTEEGGLSPYIADNNCEPVSSGWPSSWDTNVAGVYSAVVDLSETDLTGNGEWEVAIHNGDIQSSPASYSLVTWEVAGLCEVEACSDPTACNYTPNWTAENNALCVYPGFCESCNPDGTTSYVDADADGICDDEDGCSDVTADNFEDPEAAICIYYGCMNAAATNYDPGANADDGSCILLGCLDGDPVSIDGTPPACNYDPQANTDDGSCEYTSCAGCMDGGGEDGIVACNYDPLALIDDGSCDYSCQEGCMELTACNYDASVTIENGSCEYADGVCEYCSGETDGSGTVLGGDTDGDGVCNQDEVPGCTDEAACNYNASATDDDGSCEVPSLPCEECLGSYLVNFDTDGDGVCNGDEVVGCMDELACNYDDAATDDSGCIYAVAPCEVCSGGAADGTGTVVDSETVPELPDVVVVTTGSMTANPGGYVLIEDASSAYDAVEDPCGRLTYTFGSEDCPDLASVSVLPAGVHELYVTVSNGLTSTAPIPTIITVEVEENPEVCADKAACNYQVSIPCFYPGEQGDCQDPAAGVAYVNQLNTAGDGCTCVERVGTVIWMEGFDAGGAADINASEPIGVGYGYDGATEINDVGPMNPEWSLDIDASLLDGVDDPEVEEPGYWGVEGVLGDLHFEGAGLNGWELGWQSRSIDPGEFGVVAVQVEVSEENVGAGDQISFTVETSGGDEMWTASQEGELGGESMMLTSGLMDAQEILALEIRAQNDGAGKKWMFDDVTLYGWRQGCMDIRASNYDELADFEDGSCEFVWDSLSAVTTGLHNERIWLKSEDVAEGIELMEATLADLDENKRVWVEPDVSMVIDTAGLNNGCLRVKSLNIKDGGAVIVPANVILEVVEPFNAAMGSSVKGPGKLNLLGGLDWSQVDSLDLPVATLENVRLNADATIEVPAGRQLAIHGNLEFPVDTAMTLKGRVSMIGPGTRTISGHASRVEHMSIELCSESDCITVEMDTLIVNDRLSLLKGELNMDGHVLRFQSDTTGTGMLDAVPAEATLRGAAADEVVQARVERYIAQNDSGPTLNGYTLFSTPIEGAVMSDLAEIDDFFLAGFPGTEWPGSFPTVLSWDETTGEFIEPTSLDDPLHGMGGVWIFLAGFQSPNFTMEGPLRSHRADDVYELPLTRTAHGMVSVYPEPGQLVTGWNFIPNPYQGQLDVKQVLDANPFIEDQFAIFNTQIQQFERYSYEALDSLQVLGSRYIQPGNSFWVRLDVNHSAEVLQIPASAIDNASEGGAFVRSDEEDERVLVAVENAFGVNYMMVRVADDGTLSYTSRKDASFLPSTSVKAGQMAVYADGQYYISKQLPREAELPLYVVSRANMETTMRVVKAPDGLCGSIVDEVTGMTLPLIVGEEMVFTLPEHVADSARFMLSLRDFARTEAEMPSCPDTEDGKVRVHVGEGVTANLSLMDPGGAVLAQHFGVEEVGEFNMVQPGSYTVVVTGVSGTTCPKSQREVLVPPGEQPELLGLDWTASPCNAAPVELEFELYGGGTFGWSLNDDDGVVLQGAGSGEVGIVDLPPGNYALDVDHACLQEWVEIAAIDPDAPVLSWDGNEVVVAAESGEAVLEATFTGTADAYRWYLDGAMIAQDVAMSEVVSGEGNYDVVLEAERNGCVNQEILTFTVVSSLRGEEEAGWNVSARPAGWLVQFETGWKSLQWSLVDGTGRLVATAKEAEGHQLVLDYPMTAGVYHLVLRTDSHQTAIQVLAVQH